MIRKMNKQCKEKGITLVALVVTIIIMLILAGVTLNIALSDNGIFSKAKKATESYKTASEREYIEQNVLSVQLDKYMGNVSSEKLGKELNTRNLNNTSNWHIIKVNEKSYETGWNYIEKGTELEGYGKAKNSWLINYETGEVIQLGEDNYIDLSAGDMLAIKDSLIISIDSSIVDKEVKTIEEVKETLGSGVTLHGFDETGTEESGLTNESFNFDGENDWIEIDYDSVERKKELIENGFTFEFYGDTTKATVVDGNKVDSTNPDNNGGGFGWWDGIESHFAKLHFNMLRKDKQLIIKWTGATGLKEYPEILRSNDNVWEVSGMGNGTGWNAVAVHNLGNAEDFYATVTFNPKSSKKLNDETVFEIKLYINGNYIGNGWYYKGYWDNLQKEINNLNKICIARTSMNRDNYWLYPKMKIYALRLYSRALTDEEVNKNYEKSVEYHSLLEK